VTEFPGGIFRGQSLKKIAVAQLVAVPTLNPKVRGLNPKKSMQFFCLFGYLEFLLYQNLLAVEF
jgi:hypothetical protein